MSTRFKNTSNATWADFNTTGKLWRFDTVGITPTTIDCTIENLECEISSGLSNYGSLSCTFEYLTASCTGTNEEPAYTDIDCTIEYITCDMQGSVIEPSIGSVDCALEEITCVMQGKYVENWIDCQLEKLYCEGWGNMGLESTFEYISCTMDSMFGASIEGSLSELELLGVAKYCKADLKPLLQRLDVEMHSGVEMIITLQKPTMSGQGSLNIEGELQGALQYITFQASSGAYVVAEFESIGFTGIGVVPILGRLNIQTRSLSCTMQATTESIDTLVTSLQALRMVGAATSYKTEGIGASLVATMRSMGAVITGVNGQVCDLEGTLPKLLAEMTTPPEGYSLEAHLEFITAQLEVNEVSMEASIKPLTAELTSKYDHLTTQLMDITGTLTGSYLGYNNLTIELEELLMTAYSFAVIPPDGETCEPYETLKYEEEV